MAENVARTGLESKQDRHRRPGGKRVGHALESKQDRHRRPGGKRVGHAR
jgi:hypothetical protein